MFGQTLTSEKIKFSSDRTRGYSFGFNGKEKDDEISGTANKYDFGARIYDPRLGKFLSIDPMTKDFPYYSPYLFAGNNPIRYIDIDGMGPGDKFKSPDEAARDFGKTYNDNSIGAKKEYGTTIIKVTTKNDVYFTYVQPRVGSEAGVVPSTRGLAGQETVARAHTHGSYSTEYQNEFFSPKDYANAQKQKTDSYVVTPGGTLQKFDYSDQTTSILATDMPSDPNSPPSERMNNIDPAPLPKNEPTYGSWEFLKHNIMTPIINAIGGAAAIQNKAPIPNPAPTPAPAPAPTTRTP